MKNYKILIVDKEKSYREELCSLLAASAAGYRTAHAGSAREARDLAAGFRPYLIVTDVLLPDGDGVDLYEDLRDIRPDLPALFLCTDELDEARLRGLEIPADCRMMRNKAKSELAARAEKLLQRFSEKAATIPEES
ncbi:MAG: response regulator [Lachnospiraceae bacterium]|nr:response regulator [Lachnospiraceae bacterium]